MKVHYGTDNLPKISNAVITVGSYDGIHQGHKKILQRLIELTDECQGESVLITFHPHPRKIVRPEDHLDLLHTLEEKIDASRRLGIDHLVVVSFSKSFSQQPPESYIADFLVANFNPAYIVIGYDHRYGRNRVGDIGLLKQYQKEFNYKVIEIVKQEVDDIAISSTKTRNALLCGEVELANSYLGYPYQLSGIVVKGNQIGRTIGYPTANIETFDQDKLIPSDGIYAVHVIIQDVKYRGMLYIGTRPTLDDKNTRSIEVHIFDFNQDIYGEPITIVFLKKTREDERYESLDKLKLRLDQDKKDVLYFFNSSEKALVTLAILNYNGKEYLEKYLPSMQRSYSGKVDWLIIDNASTDDSISFVKENYPAANIINTGSNLGYTGGYNFGLKYITTKYVAIVNSDIEATDYWMDALIDVLESDKSVGSVQPKIKSLRQKEYFEYAGACGGYLDTLGYPYCRGRIFDTLEIDNGQYESNEYVAWTSGAAMIMRTDVFHDLDGFDADYFAHMEEIDLCLRMHKLGYSSMVIPESTVYHLGGGTLDYGNPRKIYFNFRNSLYTLIKNESPLRLLWKLPLRLILDGIAGAKFVADGNFAGIGAILKAHGAMYQNIPKLYKKRKAIKKQMGASRYASLEKQIFSIVWDYFVLGKKKYKDL